MKSMQLTECRRFQIYLATKWDLYYGTREIKAQQKFAVQTGTRDENFSAHQEIAYILHGKTKTTKRIS